MDLAGRLACVGDCFEVDCVMATTTIILWDHEPYYGSPAIRQFSVNWDGSLIRADLSVDVDPYLPAIRGGCVSRIVVNGTDVMFTGDPCNIMSADLRSVLRKGANIIEIYHNANPIPGIQSGGLYAYLVVEATGSVGGGVSGGDLPRIPWGVDYRGCHYYFGVGDVAKMIDIMLFLEYALWGLVGALAHLVVMSFAWEDRVYPLREVLFSVVIAL